MATRSPHSSSLYSYSTNQPGSSTTTTTGTSSGAVRALAAELKSLHNSPVEGFRVTVDEGSSTCGSSSSALQKNCPAGGPNMFQWQVAIFGPPGTLYQGGYFKATLKFPANYPYSPPAMRFSTKVWHPNVYESGDLCISILHPPVDDPFSGELACERWNPTQSVRTILLSVISLLNEPNTSSPANVDAAVMYRRWKESNGKDDEYAQIVKKQVDQSREDAERDGVKVPQTVEEYCQKTSANGGLIGNDHETIDSMDLDDDFYDYGDDADESDEYDGEENAEDSGQGEN